MQTQESVEPFLLGQNSVKRFLQHFEDTNAVEIK